eukprot:565473-Pleurochrysis_carterae.AAC.6
MNCIMHRPFVRRRQVAARATFAPNRPAEAASLLATRTLRSKYVSRISARHERPTCRCNRHIHTGNTETSAEVAFISTSRTEQLKVLSGEREAVCPGRCTPNSGRSPQAAGGCGYRSSPTRRNLRGYAQTSAHHVSASCSRLFRIGLTKASRRVASMPR